VPPVSYQLSGHQGPAGTGQTPCQRDPGVVFGPSGFLKALGAKAKKPHIFRKGMIFGLAAFERNSFPENVWFFGLGTPGLPNTTLPTKTLRNPVIWSVLRGRRWGGGGCPDLKTFRKCYQAPLNTLPIYFCVCVNVLQVRLKLKRKLSKYTTTQSNIGKYSV
jgi:hypothetical protein